MTKESNMIESTTRIALITGASRELGRNTAVKLAEKGVDIILNYKNGESSAHEVVRQIEALGRRAVALQLDMANSKGFGAFAESVKNVLGDIWQQTQFDYLVNNAGSGYHASFDE